MATTGNENFRIIRTVGQTVAFQGFRFTPALVEFLEEPSKTGRPELLKEFVDAHRPGKFPRGSSEMCGRFDAAWVRARLPLLFEIAPLPWVYGDFRQSLMNETFLAQTVDGATYPFLCTDRFLRVQLFFDCRMVDPDTRKAVAECFFGLLLSEPDDLASFEDHYYLDDGCGGGLCRVEFQEGRFWEVGLENS